MRVTHSSVFFFLHLIIIRSRFPFVDHFCSTTRSSWFSRCARATWPSWSSGASWDLHCHCVWVRRSWLQLGGYSALPAGWDLTGGNHLFMYICNNLLDYYCFYLTSPHFAFHSLGSGFRGQPGLPGPPGPQGPPGTVTGSVSYSGNFPRESIHAEVQHYLTSKHLMTHTSTDTKCLVGPTQPKWRCLVMMQTVNLH